MSAALAATQLRVALRDGDEMTLRRILSRADLPAITVELGRLNPISRGLARCGTRAAFMRHKDRGEVVDDACRDAERTYQRERKRAQRRQGLMVQPLAPHRRPDIDEVAVLRAVNGEKVWMTLDERREATRRLHERGRSYNEIAAALRTHQRMVHRDLTALGLVGVSDSQPLHNLSYRSATVTDMTTSPSVSGGSVVPVGEGQVAS